MLMKLKVFKMVFEFKILFSATFLLWTVHEKKEERMYKSYDGTCRDLEKRKGIRAKW